MTYESTDALQFLVEDFIEVSDETLTEEATAGVSKFQAESARRLLPGPLTGAFSMQQLALTGMPPAEFQRLRRSVRDWLLSGLTYEWTINTIKGPLKIISGTSTHAPGTSTQASRISRGVRPRRVLVLFDSAGG